MIPSRVLLTVDAVGGVWQYGLDLAGALGARGVETILALVGPSPSADQRAEAARVLGATLVETGLPLDWLSDGPAPVLAAGAAIAALAHDQRADVIQYNSPALAAVASDLPTVAVAHGCVATWWQAARVGQPLDPQFAWHQKLVGEGLRAADQVVAPTAAYARTVAQEYGLARLPVAVHNGRPARVGAAAATPHDCVLTVGRLWDPVKQTALLDRVAARLAVPFHAAGAVTGPHGETVATEHLNLLGVVDGDTLAAKLATRPVFVSAASFEPFGLAVLEAAQAGCALVLSDIATFRELWDGAATFVAPDDEAGYAAAIEALIGDADHRQQLGKAAQAHAARYTPAALGDGMLRIYADVLGRAQPRERAA